MARRHKRIICANKTHPSWDYGNRTRVSEPPLQHTCLDSATFPFRPSPYKWRRSRVGLHCCDSFAPCIAWVLPQLNHLIATIFNVLSRRLQNDYERQRRPFVIFRPHGCAVVHHQSSHSNSNHFSAILVSSFQ